MSPRGYSGGIGAREKGIVMELRGRVLSVASEAVPLLKTGGLADVVGALPGALAAVAGRCGS